jgi:hypothetical protein
VEVEGNFIHYFGSNDTNEDEEKDEGASEEVVQIQIPTEVLHAGNRAEDIAQVRALGLRKRRMKHTFALFLPLSPW